jgi:beta-glucanase (GH16 family)
MGNLAITALEESYEGSDYTSGRINTKELFDQAYGRFEARIRLPVGKGIWPAFWLLGVNIDDVSWPACGEIDILEYLGHQPNIIHGSVHGPGYSAGSAVTGSLTLSEGAFNDEFHIFAVEWDGNRIKWFMDDTQYQTVTPDQLPPNARWVFDHPFFIILNVAVGGHWPGSPDESTEFPQTMLVDWVRVYRAGR